MDQQPQSHHEPMPRFRVDFEPMELPFTCSITGVPQRFATATVLDAGYVMIDPESRQAVCVVTSLDDDDDDDLTADSE